MYFEAVFDLLPLCRYTLLKTNLQCTKNNNLDGPIAHLQTQLKGDNSLVYNIHTETRKLKTTKIKKISNIELHSIYMPHKKKLHVKIWLYNIVLTHKDYRNLLRAANRLSLNLRFVSIA